MDAEAYADMLPWLVFLVMDRKSGLGVAWAGGGGLVCSAGLVGWSYWRGRSSLLPRVGLALFSVFLVSGLVFQTWNHQVSLPRAVAVTVMSALAFGSLLFTPLSEPYTARLVAPSILEDRRFRKVNVEMTVALGVASGVVAVANGTTMALHGGPVSFTLLDWVTPLVFSAFAILWAARRWELFRLAVDSVPIGYDPHEAAVPATFMARGAVGFPAWAASRRTVAPLKLADSAEEVDADSEDAVIRRLPVRGRNT